MASLLRGPLPFGKAIAAAFNVSRPAANRATRELVNDSLLSRERGRWTSAACGSRVESALLGDELSFSDPFRDEGRLVSRAVYRLGGAALSGLADALNIPDGSSLIDGASAASCLSP